MALKRDLRIWHTRFRDFRSSKLSSTNITGRPPCLPDFQRRGSTAVMSAPVWYFLGITSIVCCGCCARVSPLDTFGRTSKRTLTASTQFYILEHTTNAIPRSRSCRKAQEASRWSWSCWWSASPPNQPRQIPSRVRKFPITFAIGFEQAISNISLQLLR